MAYAKEGVAAAVVLLRSVEDLLGGANARDDGFWHIKSAKKYDQ